MTRRTLVRVLVVLAVLVGVAVLSLRYFLTSGYVASRAASLLSARLGTPVHVAGADVGLTGQTTLTGVELFETTATQPWATADAVTADVGGLDLLTGSAVPRQLTLRGATLDLNFDKDGTLLTTLPTGSGGGAIPRVRVEASVLTLRQAGREPMVICGIDADLKPDGDGLVLVGSILDPYWGEWRLGGGAVPATGRVTLRLFSPEAHVTQAKLDALPFVSPAVWEAVKVEGVTPVEFTLAFGGEEPVHYRVAMRPTETTVRVTSIDLDADTASGRVVVEDSRVELRDVEGRSMGGTILVSRGDLDFRTDTTRMAFAVEVNGVVLGKLPSSWLDEKNRAPEKGRAALPFDGRLSGSAPELVVTVGPDGKVQTAGVGEGKIKDATILGFPTTEPIELYLKADGRRFRFSPTKPISALLLPLLMGRSKIALPEKAAEPAPLAWPSWATPASLSSALAAGAEGLNRAVAGVGDVLNHGPQLGWLGDAAGYLEMNFGLEDVDLGQLVQRLGVKVPFEIEGRLTVQVQAAIPIENPRDLKRYRFRGTAKLPRVKLAGVELAKVESRVRYDDGVLHLDELKGEIPAPGKDSAGSFAGMAKWQVVPVGDLTANLELTAIPVDLAARLLPDPRAVTSGTVSGTARLTVAGAKFDDPRSYQATAGLRAEKTTVYGLTVNKASAGLSVDRGRARLADVEAEIEGTPLTASAELRLMEPFAYTARAELKDADLATLRRLAPELRLPFETKGKLGVTADLAGKLVPFAVDAKGTARADDLGVAAWRADAVSLRWAADTSALKVTDLKARLYGGSLTGDATVPFSAAAGKADLRFEGVDLKALAKTVPDLPLVLEGDASGTVKATAKVAEDGKGHEVAVDVDLTAPKLRVQNIPAQRLVGTVSYRAGVVSYKLTGDALGGRFTLDGKFPPAKPAAGVRPAAEEDNEPRGRFRLERARLSWLWEVLRLEQTLGPLNGSFDVDLPFTLEGPSRTPRGTARVVVRNLRWNDDRLTDEIRADVRLAGDAIELREGVARVGEGVMRLRASYSMRSQRGYFTLTADRVESSLLLVLVPGLTKLVSGPADVRLSGRLGREWTGEGAVTLSRARVAGIELTEVRLPVTVTFVPGQGGGHLDVREAQARSSGGRAVGQASLRWGVNTRLEGNVRFFDVELGDALGRTGDYAFLGRGRATGRFDFGADSLKSINDLTGNLTASFTQTQALQLPVLLPVARYIAPGQAATRFDSGDLRARLARGVWRVQRLGLASAVVTLVAEGTIGLNGRLDLEVTAQTGNFTGIRPGVLRALGLQIPAIGPIPVGLILEVSSYLSNRVIHLRVTGTVRSPTIRVEPIRLLTEEAVRFFLERALLPSP